VVEKQVAILLQQISELLTQDIPDSAGYRQFSIELDQPGDASPVTWLAAQTCYPQFYWQDRDGQQEVAVCGDAYAFSTLLAAQTFIHEYAEFPDISIWGLNAFTYQKQAQKAILFPENALFLPRIEVRLKQGRCRVIVNIFSPFSLRQEVVRTLAFIRALATPAAPSAVASRVLSCEHLPKQDQWRQQVVQALSAIDEGSLQKVVLARKSTLHLDTPLEPMALVAASKAVNHHCYHFMMAFSPSESFLGASPERLFLRQGQRLSTEALAGTVVSGENARIVNDGAQWLMNDGKNQHENLLVVDDICQRLQGAVDELDVKPAQVMQLRNVQHIQRKISANLLSGDDADCLQRLQPTAAVAGLPRHLAQAFIKHHEPFNRQWYAGSAGYLSLRQSEFCVALRSARILADRLELFAGAGIVAGSDPDQEWQELENKAAGLRTLLSGQVTPVVSQE
jgi:menaquinone-specific isochorismate synthase